MITILFLLTYILGWVLGFGTCYLLTMPTKTLQPVEKRVSVRDLYPKRDQ